MATAEDVERSLSRYDSDDSDTKPLIVLTTHRGAKERCQASIDATGYPLSVVKGVPDIALARNVAFAHAMGSDADVAVFLDDDIEFAPRDLARLVEIARQHQKAVSAAYMTTVGTLAGVPMSSQGKDWLHTRWLFGLGCMAVPVPLLHHIREMHGTPCLIPPNLGSLKIDALTSTGPGSLFVRGKLVNDIWVSEDYRFCSLAGGVLLAPIRVGHLKEASILPPVSVPGDLLTGNGPWWPEVTL